MNGAASFSRITFPCWVRHFAFGKRRRMAVFSHITFRFRLAKKPTGTLVFDQFPDLFLQYPAPFPFWGRA